MHNAILAAAETATQDQGFYKFFDIVFKNLATVNDFIARGMGSSMADPEKPESKGFQSIFHLFHEWLTQGSSAPTKPAETPKAA